MPAPHLPLVGCWRNACGRRSPGAERYCGELLPACVKLFRAFILQATARRGGGLLRVAAGVTGGGVGMRFFITFCDLLNLSAGTSEEGREHLVKHRRCANSSPCGGGRGGFGL
jgi:hypothetical protein